MSTPFRPRTFAAPYAHDLVVSQSPDGRASIRVSIPGMIRTSAGPFDANTAREIAAAILEAAGVTDVDTGAGRASAHQVSDEEYGKLAEDVKAAVDGREAPQVDDGLEPVSSDVLEEPVGEPRMGLTQALGRLEREATVITGEPGYGHAVPPPGTIFFFPSPDTRTLGEQLRKSLPHGMFSQKIDLSDSSASTMFDPLAMADAEQDGQADADEAEEAHAYEPTEAEIDAVLESDHTLVTGPDFTSASEIMSGCSCGFVPEYRVGAIDSEYEEAVKRHIAREALLAARAARRDEGQDR